MATPHIVEQERRGGASRRTVLLSAQIVYHQGSIAVDCVVRNISETGAQLATVTPLDLPPSFSLWFQDGRKRSAELVWRKANLMGVRFTDVQRQEQDAGTHAKVCAEGVKARLVERIVEIERQLSELRAEITVSLRD